MPGIIGMQPKGACLASRAPHRQKDWRLGVASSDVRFASPVFGQEQQ